MKRETTSDSLEERAVHKTKRPTTSSNDSEGEAVSVEDLLNNDSLQSRMTLIDKEMKRFLDEHRGNPSVLYDAAHHLLLAGGKRLRSLITLLCCEAVRGDVREVLPFALATELLQTASLIHDDIIDEDFVRRGAKSTNRKFGAKIAVLAGDLLVAQAVQLVGDMATPEILVHLGRGGIRMCEGEAEDFLMSHDRPESFNRKRYLSVVEYKTATFMKEAARIGALVGKASKAEQEALTKYGEMLGFAYQIRDDILDVIASQQVAGKTVQSDLKGKRCNYPLVHALEVCSESERMRCLEALDQGRLDIVLQLIDETQAIEHATELAKTYVDRAKNVLDGHDFQNISMLQEIANFVLERIH
ncbi:MAG: polyprenyl synthetase family protein [Candidatus Thorarchaeota archaeon]